MSRQDIMDALENLEPETLPPEQREQLDGKERPVVVTDDERDQAGEGGREGGQRGKMNKLFASDRQTVAQLLRDLDERFRWGEIPEEEYRRARSRLEEMLNAAQQMRPQMSSKELAETVMELMDAKDKQWRKEVSLERMLVYYYIKQNCEGKELSPDKQNWQGLKVLLDDLDQQGVLRVAVPKDSFTLTGQALDVLMDYLTVNRQRGRELKGVMDSHQVQATEREHGIRRYTLGDVFRDISIRHTLRELVRQKKSLYDIQRRDFRVFIKPPRRLQTDLVLCVDSSGSMGFDQKLVYARLVAASLTKAALEKGGRVGMVTFDDLGRGLLPLTNQREEAFDYIVGINAGGNTNIGDGIRCAVQLLLREHNRNPKFIVLVTDGKPTAISKKTMPDLDLSRKDSLAEEDAILETRKALLKGVRTSVVHIADGTCRSRGLVQNIAKTGGGQVHRISSLDDFKLIMRHN